MSTIYQYVVATGKKAKKSDKGLKAWRYEGYTGAINAETLKPTKKKKGGFKTKKDAEAWALQWENKHVGTSTVQNNLTFRQVAEDWFKNRYAKGTTSKGKQRTQSTLDTARSCLETQVYPAFGDKPIAKITATEVQQQVDQWEAEYSRGKSYFTYARMVFKYAKQKQLISSNPASDIFHNPQKTSEFRLENFYNENELKFFLQGTQKLSNYKYAMLFYFLAYTGVRPGEALVLTWDDINFENQSITINKTLERLAHGRLKVGDDTKTAASNRVIDVDAKTLELLKDWRKQQKENFEQLNMTLKPEKQLIFPAAKRNTLMRPGLLQRWINRTLKQCKKIAADNPNKEYPELDPITPHGFRRTYASIAFSISGITIKDVQQQLGHSSYLTTYNIYIAVTPQKKAELADKFAKALSI